MFAKFAPKSAIRCTECGKRLEGLEFLAGRAHYLASGPYCRDCSPLPSRPPLPPPPVRIVRQRF